jgi:TRAP-type transport system small permease protein
MSRRENRIERMFGNDLTFPLELMTPFLIALNINSHYYPTIACNMRPVWMTLKGSAAHRGYMMANRQKGVPNFLDLAFPLRILSGFLFASIVTLTIAQVFCRFVLDSPLIWSEELVRLFLVWLTFLGAAVLCWDGTHLNVDSFFLKIPPKARQWVRGFNRAVAVFFLIILVYYSIPLVQIDHMTTMSAFDIPASVVRVPATIGGGLMLFFIILRWLYRVRRERQSKEDAVYDNTDAM